MYNTKYILPFTSDLNELYEIYFDVLDYSGSVTELVGTGDALTIRCTIGDENKMEPILGTEALVNIWVDEAAPITIADLVAQQDNQIRVTVFRDENYDSPVFQGFIVVEDNSQPFLDPPFALSVRALDGLGLLRGVDLEDVDGLRFVGRQSIISWIGQILYKTGQTLNIRAFFNFYENSFNQLTGPLEQAYLDAITFSQGDAFNVNSSDPTVDVIAQSADDCYTALEKIVRCLRCRLFQEDGVWNLVSLYEYLNPAGFSYREYSFGAPAAGLVPMVSVANGFNKDMTAVVGRDDIIIPHAEDQVLYLKLGTRWIKLTFSYDQSQNKVCNQDFAEGDRNATYDEVLSSSILDPAINPVVNLQTQGYDAYCWTHLNGVPGGINISGPKPSSPPTKKAYIRSVVDTLGFEKERYAVIENVYGTPSYLQSASFRADVSDIVQISVTARTRADETVGVAIMMLLLVGDDGTFWSMNTIGDGSSSSPGNGPVWRQTNSSFRLPSGAVPFIAADVSTGTLHSVNWFTFGANNNISPTVPAAKMPVSGTLQVLLASWQEGGTDVKETWFKGLSITILPYLQGSYIQLKGDYNYSATNNAIKQTEADDVEISDSPKRYFKGALLRANGDLCLPSWSRVGQNDQSRFTQLMERIMYNHLGRMIQKIEGTFKGLVYIPADDNTVVKPNGFLNSFVFTQADEPSKRFMCTSFEKDYGTGQWRGVFVETLKDHNDDGFALPDQFKFSYLFQ